MVYDPIYRCNRNTNPCKIDEETLRVILEEKLSEFVFVCADCKEEIKDTHGLPDFRNADGKRICGTCYYIDNGDGARVETQRELAANAAIPVVKRGKLRFLIGLQRSGKSVWATKWVRGIPRTDSDGVVYPRAIVCADNIRLAVTGQRYNRRAEPTVFMIKDYMIESLLARGHDVLVDGTHTTKTSIRRNYEIDIDAQWTLINTPVQVCKERAMATNQEDLLPVLDRTNRQLKSLLDEGISQICDAIRQEVLARKN